MIVNRQDAAAFAEQWIANWNRLDVDRVMSHFADQARFVSPKALRVVGRAELNGKAALRAYWEAAARRVRAIHFSLGHVVWDADRRILVVFYEADINGTKTRACEMMAFDDSGRQIDGEALYGASAGA